MKWQVITQACWSVIGGPLLFKTNNPINTKWFNNSNIWKTNLESNGNQWPHSRISNLLLNFMTVSSWNCEKYVNLNDVDIILAWHHHGWMFDPPSIRPDSVLDPIGQRYVIFNHLTMEYWKITVAIFPSRQSVFPSELLKLPWQSPLLANTRKCCRLTESIRENIG